MQTEFKQKEIVAIKNAVNELGTTGNYNNTHLRLLVDKASVQDLRSKLDEEKFTPNKNETALIKSILLFVLSDLWEVELGPRLGITLEELTKLLKTLDGLLKEETIPLSND